MPDDYYKKDANEAGNNLRRAWSYVLKNLRALRLIRSFRWWSW